MQRTTRRSSICERTIFLVSRAAETLPRVAVTRLTGYEARIQLQNQHQHQQLATGQGLVVRPSLSLLVDSGIWTTWKWLMTGARHSEKLSALHVRSESSQRLEGPSAEGKVSCSSLQMPPVDTSDDALL
ncbi:hypothetical protein CMUS01_02894 [Colletotrichum musicola]|uniref:Uncharacterized protein n=1 Tax=Colletotrichum musicola TaxID=2175873 RepID=A0A8H6NUD2_9PEZI|nr:hypothetical protein CMUS01_02894 [Colletotrichum musicola]